MICWRPVLPLAGAASMVLLPASSIAQMRAAIVFAYQYVGEAALDLPMHAS